MESNKETLVEGLVTWVEGQCALVMTSYKGEEQFEGKRYRHIEICFGVDGWGSEKKLIQKVMYELEDKLPSKILFWRCKPEIERMQPFAPEDEEFLARQPYGRYVPPKTKIRLRLSTDSEVIDGK